ncbi:MAG: HIT domain-containing protein [Patescibacteria group bacterium]|nr:HIT domain-containing protein [Patescibacteria group bacterium]
MAGCIFCKIIKGELPCYKVYENDEFLAFLDIYPRVLGHTLVIPKTHYRWVYEVKNFEKYWGVVYKITQAMKKVLKPYFITYVTHGLEVPHAHIHIMPRDEKETVFVPEIKNFSKEIMEKTAKKLKLISDFS